MSAERVWDYTTIDQFLRCRKKYYWRMVRDLNPITISPALSFGKMVHLSLEKYYKEGYDAAVAVWEGYQDREGDELRTRANGLKLMETYARVYKNCPFKVLDVEVGFAVPVYNPTDTCVNCNGVLLEEENCCILCKYPKSILYGGRIDAIIEWDSQLFALEHKTTSILGYSYFEQFRPNMQVDGYVYAVSQLMGKKCQGAVINALEPWKEVKRVTDKTKKPEDHFARKPVMRSDEELKDWSLEVNQIVCDILKTEKDHRFYKTKSACFQYNYSCPYKQLCLYGDDERLVKKDYEISKWEPYKIATED